MGSMGLFVPYKRSCNWVLGPPCSGIRSRSFRIFQWFLMEVSIPEEKTHQWRVKICQDNGSQYKYEFQLFFHVFVTGFFSMGTGKVFFCCAVEWIDYIFVPKRQRILIMRVSGLDIFWVFKKCRDLVCMDSKSSLFMFCPKKRQASLNIQGNHAFHRQEHGYGVYPGKPTWNPKNGASEDDFSFQLKDSEVQVQQCHFLWV